MLIYQPCFFIICIELHRRNFTACSVKLNITLLVESSYFTLYTDIKCQLCIAYNRSKFYKYQHFKPTLVAV